MNVHIRAKENIERCYSSIILRPHLLVGQKTNIMLPLLATSVAVAGVMLFGGDFQRLFFVFPTYQITSFKIIDFSWSLPSWTKENSFISQSVWTLYKDTFCRDRSRWQCPLKDWDGVSHIVNNIEADITDYVNTWGEDRSILTADSYASFEVSAEIHAGVSINNSQNSFGAHLHRAILDLYHQDWDGKIVNIGSMHDRGNDEDLKTGNCSADKLFTTPSEQDISRSTSDSISYSDDHILIMADQSGNTSNSYNIDENPSFSILPRQVVHTVEDAIAIHLKSISPKTMLSMVFQFVRNGGVLYITSTAAVYLKTLTPPMSVTAGAICNNALKFTPPSLRSVVVYGEKTPWFNINEVDCKVERLSTGWGNIAKLRGELRGLLLSRYDNVV